MPETWITSRLNNLRVPKSGQFFKGLKALTTKQLRDAFTQAINQLVELWLAQWLSMLPVRGCEGAAIIEAEVAGVVLFLGKGDALLVKNSSE